MRLLKKNVLHEYVNKSDASGSCDAMQKNHSPRYVRCLFAMQNPIFTKAEKKAGFLKTIILKSL